MKWHGINVCYGDQVIGYINSNKTAIGIYSYSKCYQYSDRVTGIIGAFDVEIMYLFNLEYY